MTADDPRPVGSRSSRAHRIRAGFGGREGKVRLDRNEDPVGWPPELVAELSREITPEAHAAYPDPTLLIDRIARWTGRSVDEVLITNGSTEGLRLVFETFGDEGRAILRLDPTYSLYELYESIEGLLSERVPYPADLSPPVEELLEAIAVGKPALVVVANPDQPTGVALSLDDLGRLAEATSVAGSVLAVDEAYFMFGAPSADGLLDHYDNVIVIRTFSKAFGLAGLRVGYVLAPGPLIDRLRRLEPAVPPSTVSLMGGVWAIDHLDDARERVARVVEGRSFLQDRLLEAGIRRVPSWGNFVLVPAPTTEAAGWVVAGARERGYLIKGPLDVRPVGPCIRITVGPRTLMEQFWTDCSDVLRRLAVG